MVLIIDFYVLLNSLEYKEYLMIYGLIYVLFRIFIKNIKMMIIFVWNVCWCLFDIKKLNFK